MVQSGSYDFGTSDIPYDLRQIYAVNIVGEHLQDVARARKGDNYSAYFKALRDLWIVCQHKIKYKDKNAPTKYNELIKRAISIINKYPNSFSKKNKDPTGIAYVEDSLNKIEMFLYDKIEEAKMFGAKRETEGLI